MSLKSGVSGEGEAKVKKEARGEPGPGWIKEEETGAELENSKCTNSKKIKSESIDLELGKT